MLFRNLLTIFLFNIYFIFYSRFAANEGVCLDIDECEESNACGAEPASCINQPGYFECSCPIGFLPYIGGCIGKTITFSLQEKLLFMKEGL